MQKDLIAYGSSRAGQVCKLSGKTGKKLERILLVSDIKLNIILLRRFFMRFAIPLADGILCQHFGQCSEFGFIDADPSTCKLGTLKCVTPPAHSPGALPPWIKQQGAEIVIVGGMGERAKQLFEQSGVKVILGAPSDKPEKLVQAYLAGQLTSQGEVCREHASNCDDHDNQGH